jgi:hypothetical protein
VALALSLLLVITSVLPLPWYYSASLLFIVGVLWLYIVATASATPSQSRPPGLDRT